MMPAPSARPAEPSRRLPAAVIVLSLLAVIWIAVTVGLVADHAFIRWFATSSADGVDAMRRHTVFGFYGPALRALLLSAAALVLAAAGVVIGVVALRGRSHARVWVVSLPIGALLVASAAPFVATAIANAGGVF